MALDLTPLSRPGKSVNKWLGDASPFSAFAKISKPLVGFSPPSHPLSQETMGEMGEIFEIVDMVCNQAATFNRCLNKIQDEVQDNLRLLFDELCKVFLEGGESSL